MKHTRSQCACCKQVFAGTRAFDAHRIGPYTRKQQKRRCLSPREMRLRGLTQNEQGWWMLPGKASAPKNDEEDFSDQASSKLVPDRQAEQEDSMDTALEIVPINGEYRIDSRLVARSLGIEHESGVRTIATYRAEREELGILRFQIGEIKGCGQPAKHAMLNEDQAIFLATLSRNTRQVVDFKLQLTKAFSEARRTLQSSVSAVHTLTECFRPRA